jgi:hypothetical protein
MSVDGFQTVPVSTTSGTDHIPTDTYTGYRNPINVEKSKLEQVRDRANTLVDDSKERLRKEFNADSHELAHDTPEKRGAVQIGGNLDVVRDIGWHKPNALIPDPLIAGYTNGELFAYIRRFNKVRNRKEHLSLLAKDKS